MNANRRVAISQRLRQLVAEPVKNREIGKFVCMSAAAGDAEAQKLVIDALTGPEGFVEFRNILYFPNVSWAIEALVSFNSDMLLTLHRTWPQHDLQTGDMEWGVWYAGFHHLIRNGVPAAEFPDNAYFPQVSYSSMYPGLHSPVTWQEAIEYCRSSKDNPHDSCGPYKRAASLDSVQLTGPFPSVKQVETAIGSSWLFRLLKNRMTMIPEDSRMYLRAHCLQAAATPNKSGQSIVLTRSLAASLALEVDSAVIGAMEDDLEAICLTPFLIDEEIMALAFIYFSNGRWTPA